MPIVPVTKNEQKIPNIQINLNVIIYGGIPGTVFEDKKSKKSKKMQKTHEAEQGAMLLMSKKESKPTQQRYAKIFV